MGELFLVLPLLVMPFVDASSFMHLIAFRIKLSSYDIVSAFSSSSLHIPMHANPHINWIK